MIASRIAGLIDRRPRTALLALVAVGIPVGRGGSAWIAPACAGCAVAAGLLGLRGARAGRATRLRDAVRPAGWCVAACAALMLGSLIGSAAGDTAQSRHGVHRSGPPGRAAPEQPGGPIGAVRERARVALDPGLPPVVSALLIGMALGDDSGLPSSVREEFRRSSLTHVTAASGQNVALLIALAMPMLALLGAGLRARLVACALLACIYVPLAGGDSPIRRACIMALAGLAARARGAPGGVLHPLLLAVVVTVALDPSAPESLGWQLSFVAVAGMAVIGPPLRDSLVRLGLPDLLSGPLAVTCAATLTTTPLLAHAVGRASVVAVPANLIAEPAVAVAMGLGLAACMAGQVSAALAAPLAWVAALPAAAVLEVAHLAAGPDWAAARWTPGAAATAAAVTMPFALALAAKPLALSARRVTANRTVLPAAIALDGRRRKLVAAAATAVGVGLAGVAVLGSAGGGEAQGRPRERAVFLAVEQGDAELLAEGDTGILIDTGPPGTPIARLVERSGVRRLAALVLTHGQSDHTGGLADLLSRFRPEIVIDGTAVAVGTTTPEVEGLLEERRIRRVIPEPGLRWQSGGLGFTVLSAGERPAAGAEPGPAGDPNGSATVGIGTVGSLSVLLTADAESPSLLPLALGPVDILKIPHHGSADPGLGEVIARTSPLLGVIETGPNPYGHPTGSTIRTARLATKLVRTDLDGTVTVSKSADGALALQTTRPG